jgi:exosortase H (IPTLxxWG-CTERM-specific)
VALSNWGKDHGPVWRFGLKFAGLMGLYYVLVLTPVCDRLLYEYLRASAWLANGILNWLGQDSHVSEVTIRSARFAISVRRGCDAVEPSWFFCAALLAFPAPSTRKFWGIVAGVAVLQVMNLARIVSLYFIGFKYPGAFGPIHLEVWPVVFILVAISLWLSWIKWSRPTPVSPVHAVV